MLQNQLKKIDIYKTELDKKRPFEGHLLEQIKNYYKIGLTYSSNALEGNTLTESETKVLLEDGLTVGGKPFKDFLETEGHAKAYDYMFSLINSNKITKENILEMHHLFYNSIDPKNAGKYRDIEVLITGSKYPVCPVEEIEAQMNELCKWINEKRQDYHPVVFAALLHKKLVFIHPFVDGNGRTSRMLMNYQLMVGEFLPISIAKENRLEYFEALEQYAVNGNLTPFADMVAELEEGRLDEYLSILPEQGSSPTQNM